MTITALPWILLAAMPSGVSHASTLTSVAPGDCESAANSLVDASGECYHDGSAEATSGSSAATTVYTSVCADMSVGSCARPAPCSIVSEDEPGYVYEVSVGGVSQGRICDIPDIATVTPDLVARAFRRLTWPASGLTIQPPNGRTAVNFDTYFFTDDTAAQTQTVTLLGQQVTIEATPTQFTWRYGDGTSATTSTPGAPYPDGTVVHQYRQTGATAPSLDTTYTGRYRVGGGGWVDIPDSLTVAGAAQSLDVVEIDLKLVSPS